MDEESGSKREGDGDPSQPANLVKFHSYCCWCFWKVCLLLEEGLAWSEPHSWVQGLRLCVTALGLPWVGAGPRQLQESEPRA